MNDHDPVPLRWQIEGRYGNAFSWTYIVQGPDLWQVEIGRNVASDSTADCGSEHGGDCTCGH